MGAWPGLIFAATAEGNQAGEGDEPHVEEPQAEPGPELSLLQGFAMGGGAWLDHEGFLHGAEVVAPDRIVDGLGVVSAVTLHSATEGRSLMVASKGGSVVPIQSVQVPPLRAYQ